MSDDIAKLIIKKEKEFSVLNASPLSGAGTSGPNRIGQDILTIYCMFSSLTLNET